MRPPDEQFARVGDVELCYETFGDPSQPAILLVMGLGTQMVAWHDDFCSMLVDRGFFVIRYDNRDVGRSTHFDSVPPPRPGEILRRRFRHVAYTLNDMADDGAGLLDHLGIESAHVVGASMGGMIAQVMAVRHPDRVRSLVSIMSTTGSRLRGQPALRAYPFFLRQPPEDPGAAADRLVKLFRVVGSRGFERDENELREMIALSMQRDPTSEGSARQLAGILASGNRTRDLARIKAPTVVVHGTSDRLVRPSGGKATAKAIPGAQLRMVDGMGHDLPRGAWPQIVDAIVENAAQAREPAAVPS